MSLKNYYFKKGIEICYTCKFIDEYAFNIADDGEEPLGYDGMACCDAYDETQPDGPDNMSCVSPLWKACKKYLKCSERQSKYLDVYDRKKQRTVNNPNDISKIKSDE